MEGGDHSLKVKGGKEAAAAAVTAACEAAVAFVQNIAKQDAGHSAEQPAGEKAAAEEEKPAVKPKGGRKRKGEQLAAGEQLGRAGGNKGAEESSDDHKQKGKGKRKGPVKRARKGAAV